MDGTEYSSAVVEAALLCGPPAAVAVYFTVRVLARRALSWILIYAAAYIPVIPLPAIVGLRFTAVLANVTSIDLIWPAWCFCCAYGCWAKGSLWRAPSWFAACLSVGMGYFLGTVGMLGVFFIVGDITAPPFQSFETPELACEATMWGGPGGDSGYIVVLYRRWTAVPWFRFRLTDTSVDETVSDPPVSCADLVAARR